MLGKSIIFCLYWRRQGSFYQSFLIILEGNVYFVGLALTMAHIKLGIITSVDGTCSTVPACSLLDNVIQDHHICTNKEKQSDYKIIESVETCSHYLLPAFLTLKINAAISSKRSIKPNHELRLNFRFYSFHLIMIGLL